RHDPPPALRLSSDISGQERTHARRRHPASRPRACERGSLVPLVGRADQRRSPAYRLGSSARRPRYVSAGEAAMSDPGSYLAIDPGRQMSYAHCLRGGAELRYGTWKFKQELPGECYSLFLGNLKLKIDTLPDVLI